MLTASIASCRSASSERFSNLEVFIGTSVEHVTQYFLEGCLTEIKAWRGKDMGWLCRLRPVFKHRAKTLILQKICSIIA